MKRNVFKIILIIYLLIIICFSVNADNNEVSEIIKILSKKSILSKLPGFSLLIINKDETWIKNFGYADKKDKTSITEQTLFEISDCTEIFTALAVLKLEKQGYIDLEENISNYFNNFKAFYKKEEKEIKIKHLLNHASGITNNRLSLIDLNNTNDALINSVNNLSGIKLKNIPGKKYNYSVHNYIILGALIEKVTGISFEEYVKNEIFNKYEMRDSFIGAQSDNKLMASGYKESFLMHNSQNVAEVRGMHPAKYMVTNISDLSKAVKNQLGQIENNDFDLIEKTHDIDINMPVNLKDNSYFTMGWNVSLEGDGFYERYGSNSGFSSYIAINPDTDTAVAVLMNTNNGYAKNIGQYVIGKLAGKNNIKIAKHDNIIDRSSTVVFILLSLLGLGVVLFILFSFYEIIRKKRSFEKINMRKFLFLILTILFYIPFILMIWFLPKFLPYNTWDLIKMNMPMSFYYLFYLFTGVLCVTFLMIVLNTFFPTKNKYLKVLPIISMLSLITGLLESNLMFIITNSFNVTIAQSLLISLFVFTIIAHVIFNRLSQVKITKLTNRFVYDKKMALIHKIFNMNFQHFEKIDRGTIYSTLDTDTEVIGSGTPSFITLITNSIILISIFSYILTISFFPSLVTVGIAIVISILYYFISNNAEEYYEKARDARNDFLRLINNLLDGFKELSINHKKKHEYKNDMDKVSNEFMKKNTGAMLKFINADIISSTLIFLVLGCVCFLLPLIFKDLNSYKLAGFIMVIIYIIGPIEMILSAIPELLRVNVSWKRINSIIKEIPDDNRMLDESVINNDDYNNVDSIKLDGVKFHYENNNKFENFHLGPVNFEIKKGEILFIIGGNGSGKTTLAKILTGLYTPHEGKVYINDKICEANKLGEYYSAVFNDNHLFKKIYNVDLEKKQSEIKKYLKLLKLENKVDIKDKCFSTIDLSNGQRKRLSLLKCYLEDKPIYMFDEWAADQDPQFRRFFYRELLPKMKNDGKIVIAVTHDDHYFDIADRIIKLDVGKLEDVNFNIQKFSLTK